jgi:hypothetical protein
VARVAPATAAGSARKRTGGSIGQHASGCARAAEHHTASGTMIVGNGFIGSG